MSNHYGSNHWASNHWQSNHFAGSHVIEPPVTPPVAGGGGTGLWNWRELQKKAQVEKEPSRKPRIVMARGISMLRRPIGYAESTVTHVKQGAGGSVLARATSTSTGQRLSVASGVCRIHARGGEADGTILVDKDLFERDELMELVGVDHFEDSL